jgi:hypothetical protein
MSSPQLLRRGNLVRFGLILLVILECQIVSVLVEMGFQEMAWFSVRCFLVRVVWRALTFALLTSTLSAHAADCVSLDPPASWSASTPAIPVAAVPAAPEIAPLNLVIFRHGEKPLRDDGFMIEDGNLGADASERLSKLPDRLLKAFGCPDMLLTANPAVKMLNVGCRMIALTLDVWHCSPGGRFFVT